MQKNEVKDLTVGSPMKLILSFAIPMLFGFLFQQFYNMVDTIIVGKCLGVSALAAVGSTGSINFMIIGFCTGACSGFAIPVAQKFGAGDYDGMRKFVANAGWLSAVFAAVMTTIVGFLCMRILQWMNTPEDIIHGAYDYIFVIFLGIPVTYLYNMLAGIIRSLGDSKTPVYFLLLSSLMNIALDFFTILVLGMGVRGPALATVISQGISAVLCLIYMIRHYPILHMKQGEWQPDGRMLCALCGMGIPMGLQYSITAIGSVVLQTAVNSLGSMAVAAVSTGIIYSLIAFVVLLFGGRYIALLFMDADQTEIIGRVATFLIGNSMFYIPLTFVNVVRFTIQGMGFSTFAILAGVCEMAARSLVGFCLVPVFGFLPACFASPLAWIFADAFLIPAFFHCMKKLKVLFGETTR